MAVTTLWLTDFRCFTEARVEPDPDGLTVLRGENGAGKTSVLEAVAWLALQRSFRGAPREAMVRTGAQRAVVRAETVRGGLPVLLESELPLAGPARTQVNRQPVRRRAELTDALRVSIFSPDDLVIVHGPPAGRRDYLDDALSTRHLRTQALVDEVERILRQRAAVLRQAGTSRGGAASPRADILDTLVVWDARLSQSGQQLVEERRALIDELQPLVAGAYRELAGTSEEVRLQYRCSWSGPLETALEVARRDDLRRQVSTIGPHRDDVEVTIDGRPARTHASQGEQRSVALSLRLATHQLATAIDGCPPVLLLDDVFSELDARRSSALVEQMPKGQVLLTTAVDPPPVVCVDRVVEVSGGHLVGTNRAP